MLSHAGVRQNAADYEQKCTECFALFYLLYYFYIIIYLEMDRLEMQFEPRGNN
jgi:hypothetical protein